MKFFGMRINAEKNKWKNSRKLADSEIFLRAWCVADGAHIAVTRLQMPISKCGRVALRTRIIRPPLVWICPQLCMSILSFMCPT